jgi:4-hydroxy-tetrahydrodipicolinate synthase
MAKSAPRCFVMSITPFKADGSVDDDAMAAHVNRVAASGCGFYIGSPGTGEGHSLSDSELDRIYRIAVETAGKVVPVYANPPEARTPERALHLAKLASKAGIQAVEIYTLEPGHGMTMTRREREVYYDGLIGKIDHSVTLSLQRPGVANWQLSVDDVVALCARHSNIIGIHVQGMTTPFRINLRDALDTSIAVYGPAPAALQDTLSGLDGFQSAEGNVYPELMASIAAAGAGGDVAKAAQAFRKVVSFLGRVERWGTAVRWSKLALQCLNLPGGNGIVRPPYVYPADDLGEMRAILDSVGRPAWA